MYCLFQTNSTSQCQLTELPRIGNIMYPAQAKILQDADNLRTQIKNGNQALIPKYLELHYSIRALLNQIQALHPYFTYTPIVSQYELPTTSYDFEESFEIDYLMMTYSYCCYQLVINIEYIGKIRQTLIKGQRPDQNDVQKILTNMKQAYNYLIQIRQNSIQIMPKLSNKKSAEIEEFSSQFFQQFFVYYTITANLIHFEQELELNRRVRLCSSMYKLIKSIPQTQTRLGIYLQYIENYLKLLGFKSLIDRNQFNIDKENYIQKKYTVLSLEIIQLSQEIIQLSNYIQTVVQDEDYLDIFKIQAQNWKQFALEKIKVYQGIHHNPQPIKSNLDILLEEEYFNCLN